VPAPLQQRVVRWSSRRARGRGQSIVGTDGEIRRPADRSADRRVWQGEEMERKRKKMVGPTFGGEWRASRNEGWDGEFGEVSKMKACLEDLLEMDFCTKSPNFGVEPRPSWRCFNDPCLCGVVVMRRVACCQGFLVPAPLLSSSPVSLSLSLSLSRFLDWHETVHGSHAMAAAEPPNSCGHPPLHVRPCAVRRRRQPPPCDRSSTHACAGTCSHCRAGPTA
jgi:hypothetical protein